MAADEKDEDEVGAEGTYAFGIPREIDDYAEKVKVLNVRDLLRDLVQMVMQERGWTQEQLAERLVLGKDEDGTVRKLSQSTVSKILKGKTGTKIETITALCAAVGDKDPLEFFGRHPKFESHDLVVHMQERLYQRYKDLLQLGETRSMLGLLRQARELGIFEQCVAVIEETLLLARRAVAHAEAAEKNAGRQTGSK